MKRTLGIFGYGFVGLIAIFSDFAAFADNGREFWLGLSTARFIKEEFSGYGQLTPAIGLTAKYEFELTPSFGVGLDLSYRAFRRANHCANLLMEPL